MTGLISSSRHLLGPRLGELSPTPLVQERGQPGPAQQGLSPAVAAPAPPGERRHQARWALPKGSPLPSHLHPAFGREAEQHAAQRDDMMS